MTDSKRAGEPAQQSDLINVAQLTAQYYVLRPEAGNAEHAVKFGALLQIVGGDKLIIPFC